MKIDRYLSLFAALVIVLVLVTGCTTPQTSGTATPATAVKTAAPTGVAGSSQSPAVQATTAAKITNIDTIVNFHFNDISCVDVQNEMGVTYLYPDEKYKLRASSPNVAGVNVNVLFVDENDKLILGQTKPQWDSLDKVWKYPGIVPLAQFNDITVPQEKTFTIKTQSKYYICVDDRKETGINDIMIRVPVTLTKL
jgi:hypothetical protein